MTFTIVKSDFGKFVQVSDEGVYNSILDGLRYNTRRPQADAHAHRQSLRDICEELEGLYASHDCPARWPQGAESVEVECSVW